MLFLIVKEYKKAAECVASFQLFDPEDANMKSNHKYYAEELDISEQYFKARPEAVAYEAQLRDETALLKFIEEKFTIDLMSSKAQHDQKVRVNLCLPSSNLITRSLLLDINRRKRRPYTR